MKWEINPLSVFLYFSIFHSGVCVFKNRINNANLLCHPWLLQREFQIILIDIDDFGLQLVILTPSRSNGLHTQPWRLPEGPIEKKRKQKNTPQPLPKNKIINRSINHRLYSYKKKNTYIKLSFSIFHSVIEKKSKKKK